MFNLKQILTPLGIGLILGGILSLPVKAQRIIIINQPSSGYSYSPYPRYPYPYYQNQTPRANFIYGSPISTPIPVNPYTGQSAVNNYYYPYSYGNNRVIYNHNYPNNDGYYYPNNGSSFYYNTTGEMYFNIGY